MAGTELITAEWMQALSDSAWVTGRSILEGVHAGLNASTNTLLLHIPDAGTQPRIYLPDCQAGSVEILLTGGSWKPLTDYDPILVSVGSTARSVTIVAMSGSRGITLDLNDTPTLTDLVVRPEPSWAAEQVTAAPRRKIKVSGLSLAKCSVRGTGLDLSQRDGRLKEISAADCTLTADLSVVERLVASGGVRVRIKGAVECLTLAPDTELSRPLTAASGQSTSPNLEVETLGEACSTFTLGAGFKLTCSEANRVSVQLESGSQLVISRRATHLSLTGPGKVELGSRATASRVNFKSDEVTDANRCPRVSLGESAVLREASGSLRLVLGTNAQLEGTPKGVELHGEPPEGETRDFLEGAILRNVRFPVALESLPLLAAAQLQAEVVVPLVTHDLPGGPRRWWLRKGLSAGVDPAQTNDENLKSDYASSLVRLAESKGAPPGVRTRLAWRDYNMRLSQAKRFDKFILWAYRGLGFGERPVPPALLFIATCFFFTMIQYWGHSVDPTADGIHRYLTGVADWSVSPIHLVGGPGSDAAVSNWERLGRAVLAVIFGTTALTLRKYVKRVP